MKYVADDGTVFSTEAECLSYENTPMKQLENLIKDNIDWSYNAAGFSIIEESAVLDFIVNNIDEINKILKTKTEPSTTDGWISNIGRDAEVHPESLNADTKVEVKYRNGDLHTGFANVHGDGWKETDGHPLDIIAYRILKD